MPDAKIERATDVLVQITTTNICGSDLHMYEGRTDMEPGRILGHENLGVVIEVGPAVDRIKVGDRVCLPFNIGCGFCENCEKGLSGFCLTCNPGMRRRRLRLRRAWARTAAARPNCLRVPYGDFNCLLLPRDAEEKESDYVMLADIFPTGYHATELAGVQPGRERRDLRRRSGGPDGGDVGHAAKARAKSWSSTPTRIDWRWPRRSGRSPIDDTEDDGVEQIMELTGGKGADRGCECVGYQCCNMHREEVPNLTMNNLVKTVKATGTHRRRRRVRARRSERGRQARKERPAWPSTSARSGSRARASAPARPT